jgi:CRISPR-associated protein Csd1
MDEKTAEQAKFVFQVRGRRIDFDDGDEEIVHRWTELQTSGGDTENEGKVFCLVTGKYDTIIKLHDKIELRGTSMGKQPLISMNNQTSFRSYGAQPDDPPAAVGKIAAFAYAAALNGLLKSPTNHQFIGSDTLVYWSEQGAGGEEEVLTLMSQPQESDAEKLDAIMQRAADGTFVDPDNCKMDSRFCLLCLSPNAGRISVRFFYTDYFGTILENIRSHYEALEIYKAGNDRFKYLPPWILLSETTVKKSSSDAAPLLGGQLMQSIISGGRYPATLFQAILTRIRAGEEANKTKAAIIKAALIRNYKESEVATVTLNLDSTNRAYVLGRLFSALEQLQESAGNKTLRERYFASACANPASVFSTLLKLSMHHAAKSDYAPRYEKLKEDLIGRLDEVQPFPAALSLDDQGRFIIGYYHQTQSFYTKTADKADNAESEGREASNE